MRRRDDEGTVLLLTLGLSAVLLLLVAVVVDVSKVVLARQALSATADGAAVAAAQQVDRAAVVRDGLGERVPLDPAAVAATVADYARGAGAQELGLELQGSVDGNDPETAVVVARRIVTLPFTGWLGVGQVEVRATARARSRVGP